MISTRPGLRARKKATLRAELIENAIALFSARGSEKSVTVREIADRIPVSEATFYNYFPSRAVLIEAWLALEQEQSLHEVTRAAPDAGAGLRRRSRAAVAALEARLASHAHWLGRRVARSGAVLGASATLLEWIRLAQEAGEVRADVPATTLAGLWQAAVAWAIDDWAGALARDPSAPGLTTRLLPALDLVLDGARKRHERVRAPAPGGPTAAA